MRSHPSHQLLSYARTVIRTLILREVRSYIAFGLVQLLFEWFLFVVLTSINFPVVPANVVARASAALLGFYLNGRITFRAPLSYGSLLRFALTWIGITCIDTVAIALVSGAEGIRWGQLAKPFVDALMAVAGFLLAKFWVYTAPRADPVD